MLEGQEEMRRKKGDGKFKLREVIDLGVELSSNSNSKFDEQETWIRIGDQETWREFDEQETWGKFAEQET